MPIAPPVLLTRSRLQSERFAEEVRAAFGAAVDIRIDPVVEMRTVDPNPRMNSNEGLIFTSENAVRLLDKQVALMDRTILVVGSRTAQAVRARGGRIAHEAQTVREVISWIKSSTDTTPFLHIRGRETTTEMSEELASSGHTIRVHILYEQVTIPLSPETATLLSLGPAVVPIFSRRSAERLFGGASELAGNLRIIAMSPHVANAVPARCETLPEPTGEAMLAAIGRALGA